MIGAGVKGGTPAEVVVAVTVATLVLIWFYWTSCGVTPWVWGTS